MSYQPIVKICGIGSEDILDAAIEAGADMAGFMHFPKSPRHLAIDDIGALISLARGRIETAVVLVNPDNSVIAELAAFDPDFIQLHGTEAPQRVAAIRAEAGLPVIKALPIGDPEDVEAIAVYEEVADRLLVDAKPPKNAERPGGLGIAFDWTLLKSLDPRLEFMLSGGLRPDTVGQAVGQLKPYGVDVSSGVETAPGVKDAGLIVQFVSAAREAAAGV